MPEKAEHPAEVTKRTKIPAKDETIETAKNPDDLRAMTGYKGVHNGVLPGPFAAGISVFGMTPFFLYPRNGKRGKS
jgi:hypothetical protein